MTADRAPLSRFHSLLDPLSSVDFFNQHWEKNPLHISRSDCDFFSHLLSVDRIDQLLSNGEHHFPTIQLTQSSNPVSPLEYAEPNDKINPQRLIQRHHKGATIVLSQAHSYLPELAEFTRQMQAAFQLLCQTNVYLSPPAEQGFNPHYDSHDVFILQVSGSKTFNFYAGGLDLPLNSHRFDKDKTTAGEKNESIHLTPGDTLYIPRGVLHDAVAQEDTSLHITLGVYTITLLQLLQETLQVAAEKDVRFRQSLPISDWQKQASADKLLPTTTPITDALDAEHLDTALTRLRDNISLEAEADSSGMLCNRFRAEDLTINSIIRVRDNALLNIERCGSRVQLRAFGQIVQFDEPLSGATEWLFDQQRATGVSVNELPLPDETQKLALITQLLQENLVEITDSQTHQPDTST